MHNLKQIVHFNVF